MSSTRQLAKTGTEVERLLLAAGGDERPDAESTRKAATALGLVQRAALTAAVLRATWRAARWATATGWRSISLVSAIGLFGAAGATAIAFEHAHRWPVPSVDATAIPTERTPGERDPGPAPPSAVARPVAVPASRASPASAVSSARHVAAAESVDTLREEARTLDGARNRLANGDPAASLQRLADYDRRFPNGSLHEEALLLRIEALVRLDNRTDARALAARFLKAYPASVHAERVKSLSRELPEEKAQ
jgi:hypothetical protein